MIKGNLVNVSVGLEDGRRNFGIVLSGKDASQYIQLTINLTHVTPSMINELKQSLGFEIEIQGHSEDKPKKRNVNKRNSKSKSINFRG